MLNLAGIWGMRVDVLKINAGHDCDARNGIHHLKYVLNSNAMTGGSGLSDMW